MEGDVEKKYLRRVFTEVVRGFSKIDNDEFGIFYIKHIDVFDSEEIDEKNEEYLNYAKNKGLPTEKQRLEHLKEDGLWSLDKQKEIDETTDYIKQLKLNKSKFFLKAQIDSVSQQIKDENEKLLKLVEEKFNLVGLTAEIFASKKINEYYIFNTLYKEKDLKNKLFTEEEFDELSEDNLLQLIKMFNYNSSRFSQRNLKRIALSPFFLNDFYLCEDNPMSYFGKFMLQDMKHRPSQEVMSDPDKLIEVYDAGKNAEKVMSKVDGESDASTIVGATSEDLERLGLQSNEDSAQKGVDLAKEAAKKGGNLSMEELIKLHGV